MGPEAAGKVDDSAAIPAGSSSLRIDRPASSWHEGEIGRDGALVPRQDRRPANAVRLATEIEHRLLDRRCCDPKLAELVCQGGGLGDAICRSYDVLDGNAWAEILFGKGSTREGHADSSEEKEQVLMLVLVLFAEVMVGSKVV